MSVTYPRSVLEKAAASATSLVDLVRGLNAPLGSRTCRYVRDRLRHYGIDTSHFVDEPLPERGRTAYPAALLAEAAANSSSIREMFEYMGLPPSDSPYGYVRAKLDRLGIDTSHFTSGRRQGAPSVPRARLETAVAESRSLAAVLEALGHVDNGGARIRLKRDIEKYQLSTAHFVGQGHSAGRRSPSRKAADEILVLRDGASRTRTSLLRRALDDVGVPRACAVCGTGESWRGRRLVLEVDHINGNRADDRQDNLRYLCPSCHSQTTTFSKGRTTTQ
ncbi:HNH endonuclease [Streptomyces sp. KhCrAH-43]|uniref:HNH endonuclease signature motif containing protein n=1 Tax=unclassified Streptomyces TaxID=2593676 RepID=UPI00036E251C|nr:MULTISPECIES: HNH endonuclease signature motif containing protein [unclassified Streptomyces]MYS34548.1 HNH endonuclease [Streptomyces sp. SID4920]MYX65675.1 HNH endonuclease [Streptomyces sp. SID8373]RAJ64347.1 HNH endonuclease [Streptomyces sp. KhCrAH-43]